GAARPRPAVGPEEVLHDPGGRAGVPQAARRAADGGRGSADAYSERSAMIGSIRAARRAGAKPAIAPIAISTPAAPANVNGSFGVRPKMSVRTYPGKATAAAAPTRAPAATRARISPRIIRVTCPPGAPSAIRIPISPVRCATTYDMTP